MPKESAKFQLLKMEAERALDQLEGVFDLVFWTLPMQGTDRIRSLKNWLREIF